MGQQTHGSRRASENVLVPNINEADVNDGAIGLRKLARWHGWGHMFDHYHGRGADVGAGTRGRLTGRDITMNAGVGALTILSKLHVQDVRGGYWNGHSIVGINAHGEARHTVDIGSNYGLFCAIHHANVTDGATVHVYHDIEVYNEPLTMSCRGGIFQGFGRGD